jgi:proteasome lid subunit RPN8/RPN11
MNPLSLGIQMDLSHWAEMEADVATRSPEEACGFVLGTQNHTELIIPITNILHDQHRFLMDPEEELQAFLFSEKTGKEIIGIYHSHPYGIDHPSSSDKDELTFPGIIYFIWFQNKEKWQCRSYLMEAHKEPEEVPVIISRDIEL